MEQIKKYGIEGYQAPEFEEFRWINEDGKTMDAVQLSNYKDKFIGVYCF